MKNPNKERAVKELGAKLFVARSEVASLRDQLSAERARGEAFVKVAESYMGYLYAHNCSFTLANALNAYRDADPEKP